MQIRRQVVVFDAPDLEAESSFWAAVLGGTVNKDSDWHSVIVDGDWRVAVQLAPDLQQPEWPNGTPQQIHLDLHVDDVRRAHEEVMDLGAKVLQEADFDAAEGFQVYSDPAGHPFCLCWG
jgi:predicted enzyme related to lactoylglutathione lyase